MTHISTTLPADGTTIDASDVNVPFNAIISVLNGGITSDNITPASMPWSIMAPFTNQIDPTAMKDSGNLEKYRLESSFYHIASGCTWSALTGLNGAMAAGVLYSKSGIRIVISAVATRAFTASKDTYVSISSVGALDYNEVANGAAQPALTAGYMWLAKVVTSGAAITGVTDMRAQKPVSSTSVDWSTEGKIWWEELGSVTNDASVASLTVNLTAERRFMKVMVLLNGFTATVTNYYLRVNSVSGAIHGGRITTLGTSYNTSLINNGTYVQLYGGGVWPRHVTSEIDIRRPMATSGLSVSADTSIVAGAAVADTVAARVVSDYSIFQASFPAITSVTIFISGASISPGSKISVIGHD